MAFLKKTVIDSPRSLDRASDDSCCDDAVWDADNTVQVLTPTPKVLGAERYCRLIEFGVFLARAQCTPLETLRILCGHNDDFCQPPILESEVQAIVMDLKEYAKARGPKRRKLLRLLLASASTRAAKRKVR